MKEVATEAVFLSNAELRHVLYQALVGRTSLSQVNGANCSTALALLYDKVACQVNALSHRSWQPA